MIVQTLLKNALVFNVYLKRWDLLDVVINDGRFLFIGKTHGMEFSPMETFDCCGKPLIPGMLDIHLHIESSLCTPFQFARAILKRGVTTIVSEPHEIANVFGIDGVRQMIRASDGAAVDIFYGVPSSVPSTCHGLETTGGEIGLRELQTLLEQEPEIICLGEVMNCRELISMAPSRSREFTEFMREHYPFLAIEGHCPWIKGLDLAKVLHMGVDSDHCLQDAEGLRQRLMNGMFVELQEKTITPEVVDCLLENETDGLFSFVTDDVPPNALMENGHLDHVVRKALALGMPLEKAVIASGYSPACRMGFRDRGAIAPGKLADAVLLRDRSSDFHIENVFKKGVSLERCLQENSGKRFSFPDRFLHSMNIPALHDRMFRIETSDNMTDALCRVMEKNSVNTYTNELQVSLPVKDSLVEWENSECNLVLVVDRHTGNAGVGQGLMTGCIFRAGAVATSYAHDSHNLLVAGDSADDMKIAAEWVIRNQGGICVVHRGTIAASIALPVAGLISENPLSEIAPGIQKIQDAMVSLGFSHTNPLMSFSTITLPVSPALKITDKGLVDVENGTLVDLIVV